MRIELNNICKKFEEQEVLKNLSLTLNSGDIIGLLGENGAGKTTLMRLITGYTSPDSGSITYDESLHLKKNTIGYLPETNPLYLQMYVKEYLSFIARVHDLPKSKVSEIIDKVGLSKEQHKKIIQLSKGYKQRLGIAQAIIHEPELLILDEPISGLDPNQIDEIRNLILSISKNKTVILSTHILQEVVALCNRIIILKNGEIVADKYIDSSSDIEEEFKSYTLN